MLQLHQCTLPPHPQPSPKKCDKTDKLSYIELRSEFLGGRFDHMIPAQDTKIRLWSCKEEEKDPIGISFQNKCPSSQPNTACNLTGCQSETPQSNPKPCWISFFSLENPAEFQISCSKVPWTFCLLYIEYRICGYGAESPDILKGKVAVDATPAWRWLRFFLLNIQLPSAHLISCQLKPMWWVGRVGWSQPPIRNCLCPSVN